MSGSISIEMRDRTLMPTTSDAETAKDSPGATIPMRALHQVPDHLGRFGAFGGRFVPETLMDALNQLAEAYEKAKADPEFQNAAGRLLEALRRPALAAVTSPSG